MITVAQISVTRVTRDTKHRPRPRHRPYAHTMGAGPVQACNVMSACEVVPRWL